MFVEMFHMEPQLILQQQSKIFNTIKRSPIHVLTKDHRPDPFWAIFEIHDAYLSMMWTDLQKRSLQSFSGFGPNLRIAPGPFIPPRQKIQVI